MLSNEGCGSEENRCKYFAKKVIFFNKDSNSKFDIYSQVFFTEGKTFFDFTFSILRSNVTDTLAAVASV